MKKVLPILFLLFIASFSFAQTCATCDAAFPDPSASADCAEILPDVFVCEVVLTGGPDAGNTLQCNFNATGCTGAVFPVELTMFEANYLNDKVVIKWETASEENNEMFIVQRSYDGVTFEPLYQVEGTGTSSEAKSYNVKDNSVNRYAESNVAYYRLMQVDFDGQYSFSDIITVDLKSNGGFVINNVVAQEADVTVYFLSESENTSTVSIYDMAGRIIGKTINQSSEGFNSVIVPVELVAKGMYFVNITDGQTVLTQKFIH